jgi:fimbrial chaperone protein
MLSLLLAMGLQQEAGAASLQVAPTTIVIDARKGAEGLLLQNNGRSPLPVQIRVFRWWQDHGEDQMEASDALAVSPPMLTLAPGAEQLVRIVHVGTPPPPGHDATYRVVVDELPVEEDAPPRAGLRFAMRYSIPVFVVADPDRRGNPQLSTRIVAANGVPAIEIRNSGDAIAQLADLVHVDAAGTRTPIARGLAGYVMPGQQRRWPLPPDIDASAGTVQATLNGEPRARALAPDR